MMYEKNKVSTTILGKNIVLVGDESQDYIKKISSYLNQRFDDIKNNCDSNYKTLLLLVNLADDLLKEKQKTNDLEKNLLAIKNDLAKAEANLKSYNQIIKQNKNKKG